MIRKIYFIAVNYNNASHTIAYIQSLLSLDGFENSEIIIVDNASESYDFDGLEKYCHSLLNANVHLLRSSVNVGYFPGLNIGLKHIDDRAGCLVVIGNNDLTFQSDFLIVLRHLKYDSETYAIAPDVVSLDGRHQNPHCIDRVSRFRVFCYDLYFSNYYFGKLIFWMMQILKKLVLPKSSDAWRSEQYIYMGIGAIYILTQRFLETYNALDDRVFLWGEEALLAGQISKANGKTLYAPSLVVHHYENASVAKIPSLKTYEITKASYKIYRQYL
jgi:GT2 family glycosyltransferase